jgi:hypothetical protein
MAVQIVKNFIDNESCKRIIDLLDKRATPSPREGLMSALGWNSPSIAATMTFEEKIRPDTEQEDVNSAYSLSLSEMAAYFRVEDLCLVNGFYQSMSEGAIHELHCDSCKIDGSPLDPDIKEEPNEWSAVLYLNTHGEDFTGGAVEFPKEDFEYLPEAGTLIYFPATVDYPHGVKQVTSGNRKCLVIFAGRRSKVLSQTDSFSSR